MLVTFPTLIQVTLPGSLVNYSGWRGAVSNFWKIT